MSLKFLVFKPSPILDSYVFACIGSLTNNKLRFSFFLISMIFYSLWETLSFPILMMAIIFPFSFKGFIVFIIYINYCSSIFELILIPIGFWIPLKN